MNKDVHFEQDYRVVTLAEDKCGTCQDYGMAGRGGGMEMNGLVPWLERLESISHWKRQQQQQHRADRKQASK